MWSSCLQWSKWDMTTAWVTGSKYSQSRRGSNWLLYREAIRHMCQVFQRAILQGFTQWREGPRMRDPAGQEDQRTQWSHTGWWSSFSILRVSHKGFAKRPNCDHTMVCVRVCVAVAITLGIGHNFEWLALSCICSITATRWGEIKLLFRNKSSDRCCTLWRSWGGGAEGWARILWS